ncbi:hypothetical protein LU604_20900 [Erwinia tracheiphila]|uniref:hypothetical protein n=1 Tax=Erwinia tracheiphila TaxID=65700 RepID=UPI0003A8E826|nr:hypothetical protein [Erwinia tracheiphila]UIA82862.1 hypothetical protein LU604_20900 [Erwinia tracheiphila]UIA91449.1 hypothetical protein LU632_20410 [Erwinia tracheiphila]
MFKQTANDNFHVTPHRLSGVLSRQAALRNWWLVSHNFIVRCKGICTSDADPLISH